MIGAASPIARRIVSPAKYKEESFILREALIPCYLALLFSGLLLQKGWTQSLVQAAQEKQTFVGFAQDDLRSYQQLASEMNRYLQDACKLLETGGVGSENATPSQGSYERMKESCSQLEESYARFQEVSSRLQESYARTHEESVQRMDLYSRRLRWVRYSWIFSVISAAIFGWIIYKDLQVLYFPPSEIPQQVFRL
jgi:hypothetical protein